VARRAQRDVTEGARGGVNERREGSLRPCAPSTILLRLRLRRTVPLPRTLRYGEG